LDKGWPLLRWSSKNTTGGFYSAVVLRNGRREEVDVAQIIPGVVSLSIGDIIPAYR